MRLAKLTLSLGGARSARPAAAKSYIRRQSASQLLARIRSPPSVPPSPEKSNMYSSPPAWPGKRRFQLYVGRIMLWPSRKAAIENSTGIVGTSVGAAAGSTRTRPLVKTSSRTAGSTIRGR